MFPASALLPSPKVVIIDGTQQTIPSNNRNHARAISSERMNVSLSHYFFLGAFVFALAGVGCSKNTSAAHATSPQEGAANVQSVFQNAAEEIKQQAGEVVAAVQSQNSVVAYSRLANLSGRPDLTPEQHQALFEMQMALVRQLQAESAKGNAAAEELLNHYRATK